MKRPLHPIDQQRDDWSTKDLDRFMIFCILNGPMPYAKVCEAFDLLDKHDLTYRWGLDGATMMIGNWMFNPLLLEQRIIGMLMGVGYRFPKQAAKNVMNYRRIDLNLKTASRDELVDKIDGVGMKLASMFVRNTRGEKVAVIDTHIKKWLKEQGCITRNYISQEVFFLSYCMNNDLDPYEFDMKLWNERRR